MRKGFVKKKYSEEIVFAIGVVALSILMFSAALYYKPTMIPQALRFGTGHSATRDFQVLKLPHMALDLRDNRELTLAINIEVPDNRSKEMLGGSKEILKSSIREIIAQRSSGELIGGDGRQQLKSDIAYAASRLLPPGTSINVYISDFHVQ